MNTIPKPSNDGGGDVAKKLTDFIKAIKAADAAGAMQSMFAPLPHKPCPWCGAPLMPQHSVAKGCDVLRVDHDPRCFMSALAASAYVEYISPDAVLKDHGSFQEFVCGVDDYELELWDRRDPPKQAWPVMGKEGT